MWGGWRRERLWKRGAARRGRGGSGEEGGRGRCCSGVEGKGSGKGRAGGSGSGGGAPAAGASPRARRRAAPRRRSGRPSGAPPRTPAAPGATAASAAPRPRRPASGGAARRACASAAAPPAAPHSPPPPRTAAPPAICSSAGGRAGCEGAQADGGGGLSSRRQAGEWRRRRRAGAVAAAGGRGGGGPRPRPARRAVRAPGAAAEACSHAAERAQIGRAAGAGRAAAGGAGVAQQHTTHLLGRLQRALRIQARPLRGALRVDLLQVVDVLRQLVQLPRLGRPGQGRRGGAGRGRGAGAGGGRRHRRRVRVHAGRQLSARGACAAAAGGRKEGGKKSGAVAGCLLLPRVRAGARRETAAAALHPAGLRDSLRAAGGQGPAAKMRGRPRGLRHPASTPARRSPDRRHTASSARAVATAAPRPLAHRAPRWVISHLPVATRREGRSTELAPRPPSLPRPSSLCT